MPHYAHARSDKKDEPRISIGGRLVADLMVTAGVNRVLTLALHSPQVHGFFSVPVDHLHALRELATHFRGRDLSHATVVSPDLGYAKSAAAFARRLSLPVAAGAKERISDTEVRITAIIGDVAGRDVIVLDDEIARGTTVFELLDRLFAASRRQQGLRGSSRRRFSGGPAIRPAVTTSWRTHGTRTPHCRSSRRSCGFRTRITTIRTWSSSRSSRYSSLDG
jgi:hypothetical protein